MAKLRLDVEKEIKEYKGEQIQGTSEEGDWTEQDLATKAGQPLVDSGKGKATLVRVFDFKFDPRVKREDRQLMRSRKQELFNTHSNFIRNFLWKDGLSIREDHDPKLMFGKDGYRIAVLCEARLGVMVDKKPTTLQNILSKYNKK